jgi:hypothetical protein
MEETFSEFEEELQCYCHGDNDLTLNEKGDALHTCHRSLCNDEISKLLKENSLLDVFFQAKEVLLVFFQSMNHLDDPIDPGREEDCGLPVLLLRIVASYLAIPDHDDLNK